MDDSGHCELFCNGRTTGDQNRRPVARRDACSAPCHICDRRPSINTEGICHTTNVPALQTSKLPGAFLRSPIAASVLIAIDDRPLVRIAVTSHPPVAFEGCQARS